MQRRGPAGVFPAAMPHRFGSQRVAGQTQQQCAFVGVGDQQELALYHRRGDSDGPLFPREGIGPVQPAAGRIETGNPVPCPADQHPPPCLRHDDRRRSTRRRRTAPANAPVPCVCPRRSRTHHRDRRSARSAVRPRPAAPRRYPSSASGGGTPSASRDSTPRHRWPHQSRTDARPCPAVRTPLLDENRGPRPGLIAHTAIAAIVSRGSRAAYRSASRSNERVPFTGFEHAVHHVHPARGDCRPRVAAGNRYFPLQADAR